MAHEPSDEVLSDNLSLREKCPYSELFWSAFSRIWTKYGDILRISPNSVQMRENTDQGNSEYEHFLSSVSSQSSNYVEPFGSEITATFNYLVSKVKVPST